ncbi:MAG: (Fe-S)-binding protein [Nanoarchaeota archaeon]|nr:(Fe-S)-binding protein [Nanoarchaeota archaeon]
MGLINWVKNFSSNTLYYPGCLTKGILKQEFENYKTIFNKLGIDYIMLPNDEVCCGLPVLNAGYKKDARKLAEKNFETFKKFNVKKIITNCPSCYHTFKEIYPQLIRNWNIETEHATVAIFNEIKKRGIKIKEKEFVSYHDPCHLGRYSKIYEQPRKVIEALGGKILEMKYNRENALCCGGGGGIRANFPDIAKNIAKKRVENLSGHVVKIISPCALCYLNLKTATDKSEEFSDFVLRKLEWK